MSQPSSLRSDEHDEFEAVLRRTAPSATIISTAFISASIAAMHLRRSAAWHSTAIIIRLDSDQDAAVLTP